MVTMFIKAKINDYDHWKQGYDAFTEIRKEKGVTAASVHRHIDAPDLITVTHQFKNLQAATGFAGMAELRSAMMDGGVIGPPDIWFTEDAEHTAH